MNIEFTSGDRIKWTYQHSLNRISKTMITKHGVFIRVVNHRNKKSQSAEVHFDGNKTTSTISLNKLQHE